MADDIKFDEGKNQRKAALEKLSWGPRATAIAQTMMAFGGPLLGAGLLGLIMGGSVPVLLAATLTAVGAALTLGGNIAHYYGGRVQSDGQLDQTEIGAISNAKHIVREFKKSGLVVEHEQNTRADGKEWTTVVNQETGLQQQR